MSENFHTSKKASPMFLLAAPEKAFVIPWTISPTSLVKSMTPSLRTSVVSVNLRMSQKPKIALIL